MNCVTVERRVDATEGIGEMRLSKLRGLAALTAMSVGGLGLVGAGAHAVFFTSSAASQTISVGTEQICLSTFTPDPTNGPCASGQGDNQISLPPATNVGSSFQTGPVKVYVANTGTLPITDVTAAATGNNANALFNELYICEIDGNGVTIYNGPLSGASTPRATAAMTNIASYFQPGIYGYITVDVYAGVTSPCGAPAAPSLDNAAQGLSETVTVNVAGTD